MNKKDDIELKDVLEDFQRNMFANFNCHSIGQIISFDNNNQTARIQIQYKRNVNNNFVSYPVLVDCPCVILTGGSVSLRMPIKAGDSCLVLFNDRDIDNWFISGEENILNSERMHDLSDGIALVGIRHLKNILNDYSSDEAGIVASDNTKLRFENSSKNLKTLIDSFIDILVGLTTTNCVVGAPVTLSPATISSLNSLKTEMGELLK
jgi:hypothetical protein